MDVSFIANGCEFYSQWVCDLSPVDVKCIFG